MPERIPLERLLSKWRVASRTEAQRLVKAGAVRVSGRVVKDPRQWVEVGRHSVEVEGKRVEAPSGSVAPVWLMLNKPRGVVSTTKDPEGRPTVLDLVRAQAVPGLAPVGRLDQASAGLLLLTTEAELADRLLDPRGHVYKTYRVKVRGRVSVEGLASLAKDTLEEDGLVLGPMQVTVEREGPNSTWLYVRLCEGKNRQIRRRLAALGHEVEVLVRTELGPLKLGDLKPGAFRALTEAEVRSLRRLFSARER